MAIDMQRVYLHSNPRYSVKLLLYSHIIIYYSHSIPIVFQWYSHYIPITFQWYSHYIPMTFPLYSNGIPIISPWHFHCTPMVYIYNIPSTFRLYSNGISIIFTLYSNCTLIMFPWFIIWFTDIIGLSTAATFPGHSDSGINLLKSWTIRIRVKSFKVVPHS